jgi:cytochrome c oxidase assembly protein subunit 15
VVGGDPPSAGAHAGAPARAVGRWLLACAALLFLLVVVGGITRLTRSGLSIPEWRPVAGIVPPLGAAHWERAFAAYRETPEYRLLHRGMSLAEFRAIFWWEYLHRLLARLLGLAYLAGFAVHLAKRRIDRALGGRLAAVLALGALQAWLGWLMVASGLAEVPAVDPLRRAAHLGLALALFAALVELGLGVLEPTSAARAASRPPGVRLARAIVLLVWLQAVAGALVAGASAGFVHPTFPLMGGRLVPDGLLALEPWSANFVRNPVTLQFAHRCCRLSGSA